MTQIFEAPAKESSDSATHDFRSLLERKGLLWTVRAGVKLAWRLSRDGYINRWDALTTRERVNAYFLEAQKAWARALDGEQSLRTQLEEVELMELALDKMRDLQLNAVPPEQLKWAREVRRDLVRRVRLLGGLSWAKRSAVQDLPSPPW